MEKEDSVTKTTLPLLEYTRPQFVIAQEATRKKKNKMNTYSWLHRDIRNGCETALATLFFFLNMYFKQSFSCAYTAVLPKN